MLPAPQSLMAPSEPSVLEGIVTTSPLGPHYTEAVDRQSAYETLTGKIAAGPGAPLDPAAAAESPYAGMTEAERLEHEIRGTTPPTVPPPSAPPLEPPPPKRSRSRKAEPAPAGSIVDKVLGSSAFEGFLRSAGTALAREISRGMFGNRRRR